VRADGVVTICERLILKKDGGVRGCIDKKY
jgi:hypothetical protein